jgi:PAS domain S-box-containing protein
MTPEEVLKENEGESFRLHVLNDVIIACEGPLPVSLQMDRTDFNDLPLSQLIVGISEKPMDPGKSIIRQLTPGELEIAFLKGKSEILLVAEIILMFADSATQAHDKLAIIPHTAEILRRFRTERRRLQVGINVWDIGLFEHDHLSQNLFSSRRMREVFGAPMDEDMDIVRFGSAVHPDDRNMEAIAQSHDPDGDGRFELKYRVIRPDGEERWIHSRAQTVFGVAEGQRRALRTTGTIMDITEQHRLKAALEANQQKLADILDSLPSIVFVVDKEIRITQWNHAARTYTRLPDADALNQKMDSLFPMLTNQIAYIRKAQKEQTAFNLSRIPWTDSGTTMFYNISITPLCNFINSDVVIRMDDVTEQIRMEEMLVHSEKLLSVGSLAAGMAHEINNPLSGVLQNMQVVINRLNPDFPQNQLVAEKCNISLPRMRAYMEERNILHSMDAVTDAGIRAATIVRDMLGFVRISHDAHARCDLRDLVDKSLELAGHDYDLTRQTDFRKINIERRYGTDIRTVSCDPGKIQQVLLNLIKNAGQAMFDAKVAFPRIIVRIQMRNEMVRIEFEDNGPGLKDDVARRVFEPFFSTKKIGQGTGLGLSISYFIITKEHRGAMRAENIPGGGARFIVELPWAVKPEE